MEVPCSRYSDLAIHGSLSNSGADAIVPDAICGVLCGQSSCRLPRGQQYPQIIGVAPHTTVTAPLPAYRQPHPYLVMTEHSLEAYQTTLGLGLGSDTELILMKEP